VDLFLKCTGLSSGHHPCLAVFPNSVSLNVSTATGHSTVVRFMRAKELMGCLTYSWPSAASAAKDNSDRKPESMSLDLTFRIKGCDVLQNYNLHRFSSSRVE
jgi:hypothetical protein